MKLLKKLLCTSALVLPALLSPSLVNAASTSHMLQVHVPFAFMVGSEEFAAGNYRVQQTENGVIYVQGEGRAAAAISAPGEGKIASTSTLRFASSQQHEYLVGVQTEGEPSRAIAMPATEQRRVLFTSSR